MSGRSDAGVAAARWRTIWRLHERGMAGRAIARDLSLTHQTVRHYLAKGRPADLPRLSTRLHNGPVDSHVDSHPRAPKAADAIVAGSARVRHTESDDQMMTIRCGACGNEQEVFAYNRTSRCRRCGRTCRFGHGNEAGPNVVPIRRSS